MNAVYLTCRHRCTYYLQDTMKGTQGHIKNRSYRPCFLFYKWRNNVSSPTVLVKILQTWAYRVNIRAWSANQCKYCATEAGCRSRDACRWLKRKEREDHQPLWHLCMDEEGQPCSPPASTCSIIYGSPALKCCSMGKAIYQVRGKLASLETGFSVTWNLLVRI